MRHNKKRSQQHRCVTMRQRWIISFMRSEVTAAVYAFFIFVNSFYIILKNYVTGFDAYVLVI